MSRIGILSDTHGRTFLAQTAVSLLQDAGVERIVHCGDLADVNGSSVPVLRCLPATSVFVFGNTDLLRDEAKRYAAEAGLVCLGDGGDIEIDGRRIGVTHGHQVDSLMELLEHTPPLDFLLSGHTHVPHDLSSVRPRRINPGAVWAPRKGALPSVAVVDLSTSELKTMSMP
jgi:uncharacterized protein